MSKEELRKKIKELRTNAEAILAAAEKQGRDLTTEEVREVESLTSQCSTAADQLKALDGFAALSTRLEQPAPLKASLSNPLVNYPVYKQRLVGSGLGMLGPSEQISEQPRFRDVSQAEGLFNLGKAIKGLVTGNWNGADIEANSLREGDPSAGGYLLPFHVSAQVLDLARASSVLIQAGAQTIPVEGPFAWPKITADPVAAWRGEGKAIASTVVPFSRVESKPKSLACIVPLTMELIKDCPNCESVIRDCIGKAFALELDRAGLFGSGAAHEPLGIYQTAGVGSVEMDTNGAAFVSIAEPTRTPIRKIMDTILECLEHNSTPTAAITSPQVLMDLEALVNAYGDSVKLSTVWNDLQKIVSTQVPTTLTHGSSGVTSCIFFGGFSSCVLALRSSLRIDIAEQAKTTEGLGFETGHILLRAILRADWLVQRPADIAILKGILATS